MWELRIPFFIKDQYLSQKIVKDFNEYFAVISITTRILWLKMIYFLTKAYFYFHAK